MSVVVGNAPDTVVVVGSAVGVRAIDDVIDVVVVVVVVATGSDGVGGADEPEFVGARVVVGGGGVSVVVGSGGGVGVGGGGGVCLFF